MEQVPLIEMFGDDRLELVTLSAFEPADPVGPEADCRFATLMCPIGSKRRGGTGTVREGYTTAFDHVALKTCAIPDRPAFREEYETLLKLRALRPFPTAFGYGLLDDAPAIVMEWIEGVSLSELKGKLTTEEVAELARAVFLLLERLENLVTFFVHRDLTPSNIIVRTAHAPIEAQFETGSFDLCFVDMGSAAVSGVDKDRFTDNTALVGGATPIYAAPELMCEGHDASQQNNPKVDVYSVSAIMWELLTGSFPFEASSLEELHRAKLRGAPEIDVQALDENAIQLARIFAYGMEPSQAERPSSSELCVMIDRSFS